MRRDLAGACAVAALLAAADAPAQAQRPGDLTLDRAIELALSGNEVPEAAEARTRQARAARREARAGLLPTASLVGTYTRRAREVVRDVGGESIVIQSFNALFGTATARLSLLDAPAIQATRAASRSVDATVLEAEQVRRTLAFDVAEVYLAVLAAGKVLDAADSRIELAGAILDDAKTRLGAGLGTQNDVTRAELEVASAALERTRAAGALESARLSLSYLIAAPVTGELVEPAIALPPEAGPENLVAAASGRRPDLAALDARVTAAEARALEPLLALIPSVDVAGTYRATNETGLSGRQTDWNLSVTLTWLLYDGGARLARADRLSAEAGEAALGARALRRGLDIEVRQALVDVATAEVALTQAMVRLDAAERNAEEVRARFARGLATGLDVTDGSVSAFEAAAVLAEVGFQAQQARLRLRRAVGLWPED